MRKYNQFIKSIGLTALLFTGFTVGTIAQERTTNINPENNTPVILTTTPSDGDQNVDLRSVIEITFSSDMDETTINGNTIQLNATSSESMHEGHGDMMGNQIHDRSEMNDFENSWQHSKDTPVNGTISYSNNAAVFTPNEDLKEGTQYKVTVTTGVKSSENVAFENDHNWSFTTTGSSDTEFSGNQFDNQFERSDMERTERQSERQAETRSDNRSMHATSTEASQDDKKNIELGKAGQFVILAMANINNGTESKITGHVGEGAVADGTKKEKEDRKEKRDSDTEQQTTSDQDVEWRTNQRETTTTPNVNEALEDMMSAYNSASLKKNGDELSRDESARDRLTRDDESARDRSTRDDDVTVHEDGRFHDNDLSPGTHEWNESLNIDSDVTITGSAEDVWIIRVSDDLTVDENIVFTLADGAHADNIFWYVEGEVTIGKNVEFEGIIMSMNDITLEKGAKLNGRMFSQSSISLDDNTITEPRRLTGQTTSTNR